MLGFHLEILRTDLQRTIRFISRTTHGIALGRSFLQPEDEGVHGLDFEGKPSILHAVDSASSWYVLQRCSEQRERITRKHGRETRLSFDSDTRRTLKIQRIRSIGTDKARNASVAALG